MGIKLKDVSIRTMIGLLPNIINDNNKSLTDYFDNIYDSSQDRIIKSVYAMDNNGYVKSYLGEFKNCNVDYLIVNSSISKNDFIKDLNHNNLGNRFLWNNAGSIEEILNTSLASEMKSYAHNAGSIGLETGNGIVKSVALVINEILTDIDKVKDGYFGNNTRTGNVDSYVGIYGLSDSSLLEEPTSFAFDNSLLFASKVLLKRMNLPTYLYNDIASGFLYTYYDYNKVITITDDRTVSIKGLPGSTVIIRFKDNKKKGFYRILLSRKEKKYLRISKDELVRLSIICTGNDDVYGTSWDVDTYSVRNSEDLIIERK